MKRLIYKTLALAIAIVAFAQGSNLFAQTRELNYDNLAEFIAIDVSGPFDVTVTPSTFYGARAVVDDILSGFVMIYVKSRTLYISVDSKKIPSNVKKLYRGRNAATPVYRCTVYVPTLNEIKMDDNSTLVGTQGFKSDNFRLSMGGTSVLKALSVESPLVNIDLDKKSTANLTLTASDAVTVVTAGSSNLKLAHMSKNLQLNAKANSDITADGDCITLGVTASNSADVTATGTAKTLEIDASNGSEVDLSGVEAPDAKVLIVNSAKVNVKASETLRIDVSGGTLQMQGEPVIDLVGVKNGTITRTDKTDAK